MASREQGKGFRAKYVQMGVMNMVNIPVLITHQESSPPADNKYWSLWVNLTLVTWAEWPKNFLCGACNAMTEFWIDSNEQSVQSPAFICCNEAYVYIDMHSSPSEITHMW